MWGWQQGSSAGSHFKMTPDASWRSQNFTSGKYYWELDLKDSWDWAIGVYKESRLLVGQPTDWIQRYISSCVFEVGRSFQSTYHLPKTLSFYREARGLLYCEGRGASFLNVAKISVIYRSHLGTFSYPVIHFFSNGQYDHKKYTIIYTLEFLKVFLTVTWPLYIALKYYILLQK